VRTPKTILLVLLAAVGLVMTGGTITSAAPDRSRDDQAAFDRLRQRQEDAWARGDATAWAATFSPDGDMVTFNGDHLTGRRHITERMQHYFDAYLAGTRLLMLTEKVRYVEQDTAILVRTGCVLWGEETTCTDEALSVNTNVLVKRDGKWSQSSFQNTRIRPIP
jgi:uncharacterized protein (TIGR02246 family)